MLVSCVPYHNKYEWIKIEIHIHKRGSNNKLLIAHFRLKWIKMNFITSNANRWIVFIWITLDYFSSTIKYIDGSVVVSCCCWTFMVMYVLQLIHKYFELIISRFVLEMYSYRPYQSHDVECSLAYYLCYAYGDNITVFFFERKFNFCKYFWNTSFHITNTYCFEYQWWTG